MSTQKKMIEEAKILVLSQMTEQQRSAFIAGWEKSGGYMDDLESPNPWCCPWYYEKQIKVTGEVPEEWGASWWEQCRNEVEQLLESEEDE